MKMKFNLTENKKKAIVLCSMVVLLVVAGTLNIVLNMNLAKNKEPVVGGEVTTFYTELAANRELRKNEQLVLLDSIINGENSTAEAIKEAEEQKLAICENLKTEMVIESMIKSKGYDNVAVIIGEENINVFVDKAELSKEEMASIYNIISDHTEFTIKQVSICPTLVETTEQ